MTEPQATHTAPGELSDTAVALADAAAPYRIFVSGHSLVDQPFPNYLAGIASSLGQAIEWNRHYMVGSSIRARVQGDGSVPFAGYRQGYNRDTEGMDVVAELRSPQTVSGPYDTLIITEQHGLLGSLVWNDTVLHLRHYHDRFIEGHAAGRTYFYTSWLDVSDLNDPRRWIAYERNAHRLWHCIAARVNHSLAWSGRTDRVHVMPAALALADLVERATQGGGVTGVSAGRTADTMARLFGDRVHLRPPSIYYIAAVNYAFLFNESPVGAWHPAELNGAAARSLQEAAWQFYTAHGPAETPEHTPALGDCQRWVLNEFNGLYWTYVRDTYWVQEMGWARAHLRWARLMWNWRRHFARDATNPFHFDPATDAQRQLPAP